MANQPRYPVAAILARDYPADTLRRAMTVQGGVLRLPRSLRGQPPEVVDLATQVQPAALREAAKIASAA